MALLLGIDPGLRFTGWGLVESHGNRLRHVADGVIATDSDDSVPLRLCALHDALTQLIALHRPDEAAVEETYVNRNGTATLKLGYARGVALLVPAMAGLSVAEYGAKTVKLAVVGTGGARRIAASVCTSGSGCPLTRSNSHQALVACGGPENGEPSVITQRTSPGRSLAISRA